MAGVTDDKAQNTLRKLHPCPCCYSSTCVGVEHYWIPGYLATRVSCECGCAASWCNTEAEAIDAWTRLHAAELRGRMARNHAKCDKCGKKP